LETPLHIGARVKDGDRCSLMLLKSGAGPNVPTDDGQTPVHVAAKFGNLATLLLLLEDGGDPLYKSKVRCFCSRLQFIASIISIPVKTMTIFNEIFHAMMIVRKKYWVHKINPTTLLNFIKSCGDPRFSQLKKPVAIIFTKIYENGRK